MFTLREFLDFFFIYSFKFKSPVDKFSISLIDILKCFFK